MSKKATTGALRGILYLLILACPTKGATGFMVTLESPPSYVSPYDTPRVRPSIALAFRSYLSLGYKLQFRPKLIRGNFSNHSLTFNTEYYRQGTIADSLVPVTVDAMDFLSYRKDRTASDGFQDVVTRSLADPGQKRGGRGLGISVTLPKRLNRIFGEGGAGLKVTGHRKIMFSGRSQWTDAAESEVYRQSKFPSLNMEQFYRFNISGTIGTKISVQVSEDSQQDIPLANRLIIRYKGDEDDILKSIEAGNTTLSLPNSGFAGYSQTVRGLFGVKSEAQVGNLRLIGIASQEQGSSERVSITPTGEESAEYIRDYNYAEGRIFDLGLPGDFLEGDSVLTLFVYEQVDRKLEPLAQSAVLAVDPGDTTLYSSENIWFTGGSYGMIQVDPESYQYYSIPDSNRHYIVFKSRRLSGRAVGIYMEIGRRGVGGRIDTVRIGKIPSDDIWILKLLYHNVPSPSHKTWDLMWRNCYEIRGLTVDEIDKIKIFKGVQGSEGESSSFDYQQTEGRAQKYIEILGLDQYNTRDQKVPDGRVDNSSLNEIFNPDWGLLIFPHRTPFNADTSYGGPGDTLLEKVPGIYEYYSSTDKSEASKYYIQVPAQARSSIIPLGRANIIEGSERVIVNGRQLERGTDYTIQYDFGQITLLSEEAQDPNADVQIDFEYAGFMVLQKKTLLGLRAEYEWSKNLNFGTSVLYKSDKAQNRKPRIGQETARSIMLDLNGQWRLKPNFLTGLANALPFVETETPSNLLISGEIARSYPNPNVDDVAYIDDFEAAQEQLSLSTVRTSWKQTTQPVAVADSWGRGKILWHTPRELRTVDEIYNRESRQGEGTMRTLRLVFNPDTSATRSWAGIMRGFYSRIDADRVQLFEMRAKIGQNTRGKLHIDIGNIYEDVNGDGIASTEDVNNNGAVEDFEDVGLDGLPDEEEPGYDPDTLPDPSGDNWFFLGEGKCPLPPDLCRELSNKDSKLWEEDSIYYRWLNGTEGNLNDPGWLGIPDEETLTRKGQVRFNRYFSYVIDFDSLRAAGSQPISWWRVEGSERNDWWTYRIPIKDSLAFTIYSDDGIEPRWNEVSHVRIWFEAEPNQKEPDTIEIADWYFVQTNWQDTVIYGEQSDRSTNLIVASISEEDGTFRPPPGVQPYKDPNYNVTEAQRGLQLKFENFDPHDTCQATKQLITVERYTGYRRLEMYVYGGIDPTLVDSVEFFFRLGKDSLNFYEQRRIIYPGWDSRNYINFDFNEITALKDEALRTKKDRTEWKDIDIWSDDSTYHVRGNPNINEVKYFVAGIVNLRDTAHINGELWLDELRVTEVRKDAGTAARLSVNGSIADLLSYNFSLNTQDAFFRKLSSITRGGSVNNMGSGRTSTTVNYGGTVYFDKFLPRSWGSKIPISLSQSQSTTTPRLRTNSDIVLPKEVQEAEKSIRKTYTLRISESFNHKGRNPLFSLLLNRLSSSVNYSRTFQRNVNTPYHISESYSIPASFDLGVRKVPTLPIFFWLKPLPILKKASGARLGLYPSAWKLSGTYSRELTLTDDIHYERTSSFKRDFTGKMNITYNVFDNLRTSFGYSTYRDLSDFNRVKISLSPFEFRLGIETRYSQSFDASYDPKLFGFVSTAFSFRSSYSDTYSRKNETRSGSMSRSYGVSGTFDHIKFLGGRKSKSVPTRFSGGRGKDKSQEAEAKPKDTKPFYDPPLAVLRFLTGWIKPVTYSYNKGFASSTPGMVDRPSMKYRLGFVNAPNVPTLAEGSPPSSSEDESYKLSSGFVFLGGVATDVKFSRTIGRDLIKQGKRYKSVSTAWPDLTIRIQRFQKLPLIQGLVNRFIELFSPKTGYDRQTREQYDLDGGFLYSRSVTITHSPLLSVNFNLSRSLSLTGTYNLSKDNNEKYNPADGSFQSETRSSRNSIAISTKYSFSAPGGIALPLFGKFKFKSTVSVTVDVSRSSSKSETRRAGEGWVLTEDKSDFKVSPDVSYAFSRQIRGGLRALWQDSYDNFRNRNNHRRELSLWVKIEF